MIRLTRLNGTTFMLNCELIEFLEERPDTVISMMSGRKMVVSETAREVRDRVVAYKRSILLPVQPPMREEMHEVEVTP